MARDDGRFDLLLLLGLRRRRVRSDWVPKEGDNLAPLGLPEWYVYAITTSRGQTAYDCRLEAGRLTTSRSRARR